MRDHPIRWYSGVPPVEAFGTVDGKGTPLVLNTQSDTPYYLKPDNTLKRLLGETRVNLTDAATIDVDASLGSNFKVTLAGNRALANPTNIADGQVLNFRIKQDGTGSRTLTFGSKYLFPAASPPILSTDPDALDFMSCQYDAEDDTLVCVLNHAFEATP